MTRLLLFIVITAMGMFKGHSQALVQTYTDRCTGQVYVFSVPNNGQTVVAFYNKSRTFTSAEFTNGTLQAWLEETYAWWNALSPCSSTTTGATATTNTTQQTTQTATNAASNATQNTTQNATSGTTGSAASNQTSQNTNQNTTSTNNNTSSTDTGSTGTDTSSQGGGSTSTGGSESSSSGTESSGSTSDSSQTSSSESSEGSSGSSSSEGSSSDNSDQGSSEESSGGEVEGDSNDSGESSEDSSGESSEEKQEEQQEETKEEKKDEEKSDEESDESKEEDSEEESDEEKSDDEESEDDEEEDSEEKSDDEDEEEDKENEKKKRNLAPPIVTANLMSQQMPTGEYVRAATFGLSQTSLLGTETYGVNLMVYDNLQQFMLNASYTKVHIDVPDVTEIVHQDHRHYGIGKEATLDDPTVRPLPRVNRVYSGSLGVMKMFTTYMVMMNHSIVWLGVNGSATGVALGLSSTSLETNVAGGNVFYDDVILGSSLTGFWTKPFSLSPRLKASPMVAVSSPFVSLSVFGQDKVTWNTDLMLIGGSNFTYELTQRFGLNLGVTLIDSTIEGFPTMKTFTIGGRLAF